MAHGTELSPLTRLLRALARRWRSTLPRVEGSISVEGIHAAVEVLRDRWGVPHIYARSAEDALFAQGYAHAQDRLWQMELNRRVAHGRLAEVFGKIAWPADRLMRTLGLGRSAAATLAMLDAETLAALEAYARGVNAFLAAAGRRLPLEHRLLRLRPEPWRPVDSLAWGQMMAWSLSSNWDAELLRAAMVGKIGAERTAELHGGYPPGNPVVLPSHGAADLAAGLIAGLREATTWLPVAGTVGASNNWVVDGHRTRSGRPLLANDMHLHPQLPSIWYEAHLACPDCEVAGVSLPGAPGIVVGHNARVAWGITAAYADTQDLFVERLDPDDPTRYEHAGGWERATVVREEIVVKGEDEPRVHEVVVTRHGPLVNDLAELRAHADGAPGVLALRWTGQDPNPIVRGVLRLNRAHGWDEFVAALADWRSPSLSIVYADVDGHIGYFQSGTVPVRAQGRGVAPVPGWTGDHEWTGVIPHEQLPSARDPDVGYLASANNVVTGRDYPHFLTVDTLNGHRARRIVDLLGERERHSVEDFARMQVDVSSAPARAFCEILRALEPELLAAEELATEQAEARRALGLLARWDHRLGPESVPAALYEVIQQHALRRVFEPWLGELTDPFLGVGFHPLVDPLIVTQLDQAPLVLERLLREDATRWWRGSTRARLLAGALADALRWLRATLGPEMHEWRWGRIHGVSFEHALGARKPLDAIFNRGPFPYGGDPNTVWQAAYLPRLPIGAAGSVTASWRQVLDVSDWDASIGMHAPGQSGHPASPHFDDLIEPWLEGRGHPLLWTRAKVEAELEARLELVPARATPV